MTIRPRHPDKDLESIMSEAEEHRWVFVKRKKYYFGKCHCGTHMKTVKMTPSGSNYGKNLLAWFKRQLCWDKEGSE